MTFNTWCDGRLQPEQLLYAEASVRPNRCNIKPKSLAPIRNEVGFLLATFFLITVQQFSMTLRSAELPDQPSRTRNHTFTAFAVCAGALSC